MAESTEFTENEEQLPQKPKSKKLLTALTNFITAKDVAARELAGAAFRQVWAQSPERDRFTKAWAWCGAGAISLLIACWFVLMAVNLDDLYMPNQAQSRFSIMFIISMFVIVVTVLGLISYRTQLQQIVRDRIRLGVTSDIRDLEVTDFAALWMATQQRIDVYHDIATRQANTSFRNGQVVAIAGFVVIIGTAVFASRSANGTAAVAASVTGVAGAGLSAYIGSTFMKAQSQASAQLREYFLQPVEFARSLAVERLIQTLDAEDRPEVVGRVVEAMISNRLRSTSAPDISN